MPRDEERREVAIRSCCWGLGAVLPINAQLWRRSHRRGRTWIGKRHTGFGRTGRCRDQAGFVGRRPTYFLSSPPPTQARIAATFWRG